MLKAVCKLVASSFKDWFDCFLKLRGKKTTALIAVIMWMIWRCRNQKIFEDKDGVAKQVGEFAKAFLHEFWNIHNTKGTRRSIEYHKWVAPAEHLLKLNVDGAFSEAAAGVGVVVRNHLGQVEAILATRVTTALNAEHVECLAFLSALEFARDFGITHFLLEGDALNIVERINSNEPDLSLIGNIVHGIRSLLATFDFVKVNYVRRTNNVPAHIVSKMSLSLEGSRVWFVDFPKAVTDAALQDLT
ncbi:uncharacterized protein [Coffea arabica]|uniref:RNase H type-1 domain-containing protein n=1 Tax=Coffea arabica TaxID=13443 RepID=A0A6P6SC95_COFAR|nr:uncharacterized protein LOC113689565 [Coffea arabica]